MLTLFSLFQLIVIFVVVLQVTIHCLINCNAGFSYLSLGGISVAGLEDFCSLNIIQFISQLYNYTYNIVKSTAPFHLQSYNIED